MGDEPAIDTAEVARALLDIAVDFIEFQEEMTGRLVAMRARLISLAERLGDV